MAKLVDALDLGSRARKGVWVQVPPLAPNKKGEQVVVSFDISSSGLSFALEKIRPTLCKVAITVPQHVVSLVYEQATLAQCDHIQAPGFQKGSIPISYVEHHFGATLTEHLKEFLFNYFALSFLFDQLTLHKLAIAGDPRLLTMDVEPHKDARFTFELTIFPELELQEWRYFPFKAPKRKKYKDLDRQVENFVNDEKENLKSLTGSSVAVNDWVNFEVRLVSPEGVPLLGAHEKSLWLKIGDEEADGPLRDIFLGKSVGEQFCTISAALQEYFSYRMNARYTFCITIKSILHHKYFSFDDFKRHFKLKTNKDMMRKLIEVFSYRNDISQRRAMAEDSLALLLARHSFSVPNHLVLRQQKAVLNRIKTNSDYHVYRMQRDFKERVFQLAQKQAKETILIDQIAYAENLQVTRQDIECYLNLTKRPRMKEFIYFDPPISKVDGKEMPLSEEEMKHACLREKTLNYIIYHLTQE